MCAAKIYLSLSNECDGDLEAMPVVAAVNNLYPILITRTLQFRSVARLQM